MQPIQIIKKEHQSMAFFSLQSLDDSKYYHYSAYLMANLKVIIPSTVIGTQKLDIPYAKFSPV